MPKRSKKQLEMESAAMCIVENDAVAMFASDEDKLIFQHFVLKGMEFEKSKLKKSSDFPEYKSFVDVWDKKYHMIGLRMPRDGAKLKSIITQTREYLSKAGTQVTPETTIQFWQIFVDNLYKTWGHGKDLATIESKYTSLIFEMQNGKQRNNFSSRTSTQRIIDSL